MFGNPSSSSARCRCLDIGIMISNVGVRMLGIQSLIIFSGKGGCSNNWMVRIIRITTVLHFSNQSLTSIRLPLQVSDLTNGTLLQEGHDKRPDFTLEEQLPDRGDFGGGDFLEDGFGFGDGGMGEFGELPNVPDLTVDEAQKKQEEGGQT